ncbi:MAG: hypothetical protein Ct9H300mP12_09190 [Acidimicrobiales bacterium]|nr:MAG: hypothetical protein Ct9H300mP12_09190 [Acidimicrobiales bacterium]
MRVLESHVCGIWRAPSADGVVARHAITGEPVAFVSSAGIDLSAAVTHARDIGGPPLDP